MVELIIASVVQRPRSPDWPLEPSGDSTPDRGVHRGEGNLTPAAGRGESRRPWKQHFKPRNTPTTRNGAASESYLACSRKKVAGSAALTSTVFESSTTPIGTATSAQSAAGPTTGDCWSVKPVDGA